jgi:hypothetical protein
MAPYGDREMDERLIGQESTCWSSNAPRCKVLKPYILNRVECTGEEDRGARFRFVIGAKTHIIGEKSKLGPAKRSLSLS